MRYPHGQRAHAVPGNEIACQRLHPAGGPDFKDPASPSVKRRINALGPVHVVREHGARELRGDFWVQADSPGPAFYLFHRILHGGMVERGRNVKVGNGDCGGLDFLPFRKGRVLLQRGLHSGKLNRCSDDDEAPPSVVEANAGTGFMQLLLRRTGHRRHGCALRGADEPSAARGSHHGCADETRQCQSPRWAHALLHHRCGEHALGMADAAHSVLEFYSVCAQVF